MTPPDWPAILAGTDCQLLATEDDRPAWLAARRTGIGASDASAVLGLSQWATPLSVYFEKVATDPPDDWTPSEAAEWGNRLESVVAEAFSERTGIPLIGKPGLLANRARRWQLATPDALLDHQTGLGLLEVKTVGRAGADDWDGTEIPYHALIQVHHQMLVTGIHAAWVACLIMGQRLVIREVPHDRELHDRINAVEAAFWEKVQHRTPPEPLGHRADIQALARAYPEATGGTTELPPDVHELVHDYRRQSAGLAALQTIRDATEARLKLALGDASTGTIDGATAVTWPSYTRETWNTRQLERDQPALRAQYARTTTYRRFTVKEPKP